MAGGVTIVQYRTDKTELAEILPELLPLRDFLRGAGVSLIIDNDVDLAVKIGADGVHVGQNDMPVAETACTLNPGRMVLLPDMDANCSLEASCPAEDLAAFLEANASRNYYVVAYINCSAQVKALADVIVTSGNAKTVVEVAPTDRPILFVPDQNLGAWVARATGREMTLWNGACHVHQQFTREQVLALKAQHPGAEIVCHPECTEIVRLLAGHICSTEKMITYCRESLARSFIIVTENGILHRLRKLVPGKEFIGFTDPKCTCAECGYMKLNTLQKVRDCLLHMSPVVTLPEPLRQRAATPLLRMLEISRPSAS